MDPESKKLLKETLALTEENNEILRSVRRSMRWARIMSFLYWVFIIGSAIGAYYYIQPYLEQLMEVYGNVQGTFDSIKQFGR